MNVLDTPNDLVFKTNNDAHVEKTWWEWTREHVAYELETLREAVGQVIGMKAREVREDLMREINFVKRELGVLREEVAVEHKLKNLQSEIASAQADVPRLPTVEAKFFAEQAATKKELERLRRELATAKDKISALTVENSQIRYTLNEMEKQPRTTIDPATLEVWKAAAAEWLKQQEQPEPPHLLLPHGHVLPLEQPSDGASSN